MSAFVNEEKLAREAAQQLRDVVLPEAEVRIRRIIQDLTTRPLVVKGTIAGVTVDATFQLGERTQ